MARVAAKVAAAVGKVAHLAGKAGIAPAIKTLVVGNGGCGGDTGKIETALARQPLQFKRGDTVIVERCTPRPLHPTLPTLLLDFHNVTVKRGERHALRGLTLQVEEGEHVAILGPNGSGKSTLLKLLQRECYPLRLPGTQLRILEQESWNIFTLRHRLGIITNDLMAQCTRDITGRELVLSGFFGSVGIWPGQQTVTDEHEKVAREAMERLGVGHLADRWTDELSSGEGRRLLVARALIHRPRTLVFDEPTTSLDLAAQRDMRETMRRLCREGTGLLLVTHHLEEIVPEITRVVLLKKGEIWKDGRKEDVLTEDALQEVFGAPVEVTEQDGFYRVW